MPVEETKDTRKRFKTYEIGYVHIDSAELRHAGSKLIMFLGIDRVSKFTHVEFYDSAGKAEGAAFLRSVTDVFPYKIYTVLTDNGMAFADLPKNRNGSTRRDLGPHVFDRVCAEKGIEHRLTKPYHSVDQRPGRTDEPSGQDATVKVYHYDDLQSLKAHDLRHRLQFRQAPEGLALANTLPSHLRALDRQTVSLQDQPAPPRSGTTHLVRTPRTSAICMNAPLPFRSGLKLI